MLKQYCQCNSRDLKFTLEKKPTKQSQESHHKVRRFSVQGLLIVSNDLSQWMESSQSLF